VPTATLGTDVRILASGLGDVGGPVDVTVALTGRSILPLSPIHLTWCELGNGDVAVRWIRRSRAGLRWVDGVDAPLAEEREVYRVALVSPDGRAIAVQTTEPALTVQRADRIAGLSLAVRQVGAHGESAALNGMIPAWVD